MQFSSKNIINPYRFFSLSLGIFILLPFHTTGMAQTVDSPIKTTNQNNPLANKNKFILKNNSLLLRLKRQQFIVLKLEQRMVYVYQNDGIVASYPVAIGKPQWETPKGNFKVIQKLENPGWTNFKTGERISPGKDNPLGERWIAFWTDGKDYIGFHGTPDRASVGQAISHGCVRMYNEDIRQLYEVVKIGTPVIVEP